VDGCTSASVRSCKRICNDVGGRKRFSFRQGIQSYLYISRFAGATSARLPLSEVS